MSLARFSGPGFVFEPGDWIGIDLDGCRNPETSEIADWAKKVIVGVGSYAEVSPSGRGVKIFAKRVGEWTWQKKFSERGGSHQGWEVYTEGRYFAVTGLRLSGMTKITSIACDALAGLLGALKATFEKPVEDWKQTPVTERAAKYLEKMDPAIAGQKGHDKLFKAACMMVKGFGLSTDEAFGLLAREYNHRCDPEWSERELLHKIRDASNQPGPTGYMLEVQPINYQRQPVPEYKPTLPEEPPAECRVVTLEDASLAYLESVREGKRKLVETGIPDLDYAIGGGMEFGEMMVLAARPNHGKSAVALQMLHHMTAQGLASVMISEEMTATALGKRAVQFATARPEEHWRGDMATVLRDVSEHFANRAKAIIVESCGTSGRACAEIEKAVEKHGVKVAFIDYAQILSGAGKSRSLYESVTEVSKALRRLTTKLNIITILLAQLSRNVEGRESCSPQMRDIKESGQIEQDADVILFGVWPHRLDHTRPAKEYQFFVGKNRNRGIMQGAFQCNFLPSRQMMVAEKPTVTEWEYANSEEF